MSSSNGIRHAVERAIGAYAPIRSGETTIQVALEGGAVVLRGHVRTDAMRGVAGHLAQQVRGVQAVRNDLVSDSSLDIAVGQALETQLGPLALPVIPVVRAIRGHIFLRGPIPAADARELAAEIVEAVAGVVSVENGLVVDAGGIARTLAPQPTPAMELAPAVQPPAVEPAVMTSVGEPLEAEFPAWALKPKAEWGPEDFKAQMQAKRGWKGGTGEDPDVTIERAQATLAAQSAAPEVGIGSVDNGAAALAALRGKYPAWALLPRSGWTAAEFEEAAVARVMEVRGRGPATDTLWAAAQAALVTATRQGDGAAREGTGPRALTADEVAQVRATLAEQFPTWALKPKEEWDPGDFKAQMQAKRAAKGGAGEEPDAITARAQAALEQALQAAQATLPGTAVAEGAPASSSAIPPELFDRFPAWALKPKAEWEAGDFKAHAKAKGAFKKGEGPDPDAVGIEAQAALDLARRGVKPSEAPPVVAVEPRPIPPDLFDRFPAWALKPKAEWDAGDFKAHAKAKGAFKKGEGPDPDAVVAEAQAAL